MVWSDIFTSSTFWIVMLALAVFGYGVIRSSPLKKLPVFNNKNTFMLVALAGLLLTSGLIGSWSLGSLSQSASVAGVSVSALQVTTSFTTGAGGSIGENANVDDLIDVRMTDAQSNETSGVYEATTGILTVTRTGSLDPISCDVVASTPSYTGETASTQGNSVSYKILEETTTGDLNAYLKAGGAAATTDPKETTSLAFADGVATATLGVLLQVDEEAHDALSQYSYKDVVVDVCGKPFTFRIHRMD